MAEIDRSRLLAEIEEEARRLRRDGLISVGFERQLDRSFDQFSPPSTSDDLELVITSAGDLAYVNADVPVDSRIAGGTVVKKGVRRLVYWCLNYVTGQVQSFAVVVARGLRLLGRRVESLERATPALSSGVAAEVARLSPAVDLEPWTTAIVDAARRTDGRVVHAECGDGTVVRALEAAGLDGYGVEPRSTAADAAAAAGVEVRDGDALEHLRLLPDEVLGGVVLSGCVDRYSLPSTLALLDETTRVLAPGGRVLVVSATPATWGTGSSEVLADLAPGRPLRAATWEHLLTVRGYESIVVTDGVPATVPASVLITARRPGP